MVKRIMKMIWRCWRGFIRLYYTWIVRRRAASAKGRLRVNYRSSVTKKTYLGNNVNFNGMKILGRGVVRIGDNFHSGKICSMMTDYHNYDRGTKIPYDDTYVIKDIRIEDNVWLGNEVMILPGVTIGEGAVIQAGSVVVNDIPPLAVAGGHPARVFKNRDKDHYFDLKEKNRFH